MVGVLVQYAVHHSWETMSCVAIKLNGCAELHSSAALLPFTDHASCPKHRAPRMRTSCSAGCTMSSAVAIHAGTSLQGSARATSHAHRLRPRRCRAAYGRNRLP